MPVSGDIVENVGQENLGPAKREPWHDDKQMGANIAAHAVRRID